MHFTVLPVGGQHPANAVSTVFLRTDRWDDWFRYNTQYYLIYHDETAEEHYIGQVKIGQFGMEPGQRRANLPDGFDSLDAEFFSLGQDDSYYERLNNLGEEVRDEILRALNDVALDEDLFERTLQEDVTGVSLLRSVNRATVEGQFRRLARGGARLSDYRFTYVAPSEGRHLQHPTVFEFSVEAESQPPTNIHVLIGRNGVGKTTLLNNMTQALVDPDMDPLKTGVFNVNGSGGVGFANIVSVTFSAFDPFEPISTSRNRASGTQFEYIGLKRRRAKNDDKPLPPKSHTALAQEFGSSVRVCIQGARLARWRRALQMLEADPIFNDANVAGLAEADVDDEDLKQKARTLFRRLSSGHKIVLLTVTRLVESVEERSLVLLDEPEAHLHPPLLSAFVRALSDLLINRNGVAIVATHSPVVLQEVPRRCVWKLRRSGFELVADQPDLETFGENVGVLTREVFGLEVTRAGFHRMLREAVDEGGTYESIVDDFGGALGGEAKALVRGLLALRELGDS